MNHYYTPLGILEAKIQNDKVLSCRFVIPDKNDYIFNLDNISEALKTYFVQKLDFEDKTYTLTANSEFQKMVLLATKNILIGQTKTYQEIAQAINNKDAFRAVGNALNKNPLPLFIPCHRVIGQKKLSSYGGGNWRKEILLLHEKGFFDELGIVHGSVELKPYNPKWPEMYKIEEKIILNECSCIIKKIHHIGSTSIENIQSKPIIDIMIELDDFSCKEQIFKELLNIGYIFRMQAREDWIFMSKGFNEKKMYHLHLVFKDSEFAQEHLIFRDNLRKYPSIAKEYEHLKIDLLSQYRDSPEDYTINKSNFIYEHSQAIK